MVLSFAPIAGTVFLDVAHQLARRSAPARAVARRAQRGRCLLRAAHDATGGAPRDFGRTSSLRGRAARVGRSVHDRLRRRQRGRPTSDGGARSGAVVGRRREAWRRVDRCAAQRRARSCACSKGGADREYQVSQSAVLAGDGDVATITDTSGAVIDTIRLSIENGVRTLATRDATFSLTPTSASLDARYRRGLRNGAALSGSRWSARAPMAYERFVRVREVPAAERAIRFWLSRGAPVLVTASSPFTVRGGAAERWCARVCRFGDRRRSSERRTLALRAAHLAARAERERRPSGLLPTQPSPARHAVAAGVNCPANAACGAISLRRFPPPRRPHLAG